MAENKQYVSALDVGTSKVIALIGEVVADEINIVGMGLAESRGLKAGMVTNIDATAQAIHQAMSEAERMAECKITSVVTGISGNHIRSLNSQGVVKIKDGEVTKADIERAKDTAKAVNIPPDHQILHTVVQEYIIDNQPGVREPIGMSGVRLDTRVHIITGAVTALQNVQKCIERCGLKVDEIMLQPLVSADAVLTEDEKELGVCVIDIGGGTTDIAVYTNGAIRHTAVIPIAGDLITRDLAQALRTPYAAAERIKIFQRRCLGKPRRLGRNGGSAQRGRPPAAPNLAPHARQRHRAARGRNFGAYVKRTAPRRLPRRSFNFGHRAHGRRIFAAWRGGIGRRCVQFACAHWRATRSGHVIRPHPQSALCHGNRLAVRREKTRPAKWHQRRQTQSPHQQHRCREACYQ